MDSTKHSTRDKKGRFIPRKKAGKAVPKMNPKTRVDDSATVDLLNSVNESHAVQAEARNSFSPTKYLGGLIAGIFNGVAGSKAVSEGHNGSEESSSGEESDETAPQPPTTSHDDLYSATPLESAPRRSTRRSSALRKASPLKRKRDSMSSGPEREGSKEQDEEQKKKQNGHAAKRARFEPKALKTTSGTKRTTPGATRENSAVEQSAPNTAVGPLEKAIPELLPNKGHQQHQTSAHAQAEVEAGDGLPDVQEPTSKGSPDQAIGHTQVQVVIPVNENSGFSEILMDPSPKKPTAPFKDPKAYLLKAKKPTPPISVEAERTVTPEVNEIYDFEGSEDEEEPTVELPEFWSGIIRTEGLNEMIYWAGRVGRHHNKSDDSWGPKRKRTLKTRFGRRTARRIDALTEAYQQLEQSRNDRDEDEANIALKDIRDMIIALSEHVDNILTAFKKSEDSREDILLDVYHLTLPSLINSVRFGLASHITEMDLSKVSLRELIGLADHIIRLTTAALEQPEEIQPHGKAQIRKPYRQILRLVKEFSHSCQGQFEKMDQLGRHKASLEKERREEEQRIFREDQKKAEMRKQAEEKNRLIKEEFDRKMKALKQDSLVSQRLQIEREKDRKREERRKELAEKQKEDEAQRERRARARALMQGQQDGEDSGVGFGDGNGNFEDGFEDEDEDSRFSHLHHIPKPLEENPRPARPIQHPKTKPPAPQPKEGWALLKPREQKTFIDEMKAKWHYEQEHGMKDEEVWERLGRKLNRSFDEVVSIARKLQAAFDWDHGEGRLNGEGFEWTYEVI